MEQCIKHPSRFGSCARERDPLCLFFVPIFGMREIIRKARGVRLVFHFGSWSKWNHGSLVVVLISINVGQWKVLLVWLASSVPLWAWPKHSPLVLTGTKNGKIPGPDPPEVVSVIMTGVVHCPNKRVRDSLLPCALLVLVTCDISHEKCPVLHWWARKKKICPSFLLAGPGHGLWWTCAPVGP